MKKIGLITGVSREEGIGYGVALEMATRGFEVLIGARDLAKAEKLAKQITELVAGASVFALALDITEEASVLAAADWVENRFGRLDILINNAGAFLDYGKHPLDTDFDYMRDAFETNLFGAWRMTKGFQNLLHKSAQPRIVNISSGAGSFSDPLFGLGVHPAIVTAYGISKLALNGLTVKLARQLKEANILVNAVCPGFVATAPGMENMGARPVKEAVGGIIWAATLPEDGPTGGFFRDGVAIGW